VPHVIQRGLGDVALRQTLPVDVSGAGPSAPALEGVCRA
jgi:hypothetical protein